MSDNLPEQKGNSMTPRATIKVVPCKTRREMFHVEVDGKPHSEEFTSPWCAPESEANAKAAELRGEAERAQEPDVIEQLLGACVGHPDAKIPWPHRVLHNAVAEITRLRNTLAVSTPPAPEIEIAGQDSSRKCYICKEEFIRGEQYVRNQGNEQHVKPCTPPVAPNCHICGTPQGKNPQFGRHAEECPYAKMAAEIARLSAALSSAQAVAGACPCYRNDEIGCKIHGPLSETAAPAPEPYEKVHTLLEQWEQVWEGDKAKLLSEFPQWIVDAAAELFAHDMCDKWDWNDYTRAAAAIISRHREPAPFSPPSASQGEGGQGVEEHYLVDDAILSGIELPNPCEIRLDIYPDRVSLKIGQRDFGWNRKHPDSTDSGTWLGSGGDTPTQQAGGGSGDGIVR